MLDMNNIVDAIHVSSGATLEMVNITVSPWCFFPLACGSLHFAGTPYYLLLCSLIRAGIAAAELRRGWLPCTVASAAEQLLPCISLAKQTAKNVSKWPHPWAGHLFWQHMIIQ